MLPIVKNVRCVNVLGAMMASQVPTGSFQANGDRSGRTRVLNFWSFSNAFPYLLIPVILYNLIAFFSATKSADGGPGIQNIVGNPAFTLPMLSGVSMHVTWGEIIILFSIVFLFIEILKSTNSRSSGIVNHILSMMLFVFCLIQFLMFGSFATGTYFIITMIVLLDALAGMIVTIISARRDFGVEGMNS
jgi:hypothetical protein